MVINMATNLNKIELEKNNFIRKLSREQFDGVITNKYKKVFMDYFNGIINDNELTERINKNLELVNVYENGDSGKIDSNQYLYSAIVEVALNYYNVANGFETCINKVNLFASYFQLCATAESKLDYLSGLIYDVFYINENFDGDCADEFLKVKLDHVRTVADSLEKIIGEIVKHEDVIADVEKDSGIGFCDEILMDESIKNMFVMFQDSAKQIQVDFKALVEDCIDENTGANLDIMNGTLTGGADE